MTYLVFLRKHGGAPWYLDGDTALGADFVYTENRTKAQRCTRAMCVRYMRELLSQPANGWVAGFEGV